MSVKKNLLYSVFYQVLILIIPLLTTPYISRVLGPDAIGIQAYTYSIVNYFVVIAMLGINNYGNRSVAMARDNQQELNKVFTGIYMIQVIMSGIMMTAYIYLLSVVENKYRILLTIQSIYIISTALDINWLFFGLEKFKLTVARNTIIKICSMLCIFIFVKNVNDLYIYAFILAMGMCMSNLILWKFRKKYVQFVSINISEIKPHIKPILILFIPVIAISIYKIMDKIMLGTISGTLQVGFYENSEKIIAIPLSIITAVGMVMMPKMANLESKANEYESKKYISISMEMIMIVSIASTFGIMGVSNILIPVFLGEQFIGSICVVRALSVTILFISWANVIRTQFLIPKKKDKIYIKSAILGAFVNVVLNLLLIKSYGAVGAAVGTIGAEAIVAIYQTIKVKEELEVYDYIKNSIFYIVPGIIMYYVVSYIGSNYGGTVLSLIYQVIIGGLVYIVITLIYMSVTKNRIISNLCRKKSKSLRA